MAHLAPGSASLSAPASLRDVTTILFDPSLRTRSDVESFLASKPVGTAHVLHGPGAPAPNSLGLVKTERGFLEVSFGSYAKSSVAGTDYDLLQENIFSRVRVHGGSRLAFAAGFELQIRSAPFTAARADADQFQLFCLSNKSHAQSYFDLQLVCENGEICAYNRRIAGRAVHSGDELRSSILLHGVSFKNGGGRARYYVCVVGYNKTELARFTDQIPTVVFVDPEEGGLNLLPCSLARSEIRDATAAIIAVVEYDPRASKWSVVPVNGCIASGPRLNTGVLTAELKDAVARANSIFDERISQALVDSAASTGPVDSAASTGPVDSPVDSMHDYRVSLFAEAGLFDTARAILPCEFTSVFKCGPGVDIGVDIAPGCPNLPCWFGPMEMHCAANANGVPPTRPFAWDGPRGVRAGLESAALAVVVVSRHWSHEVAPLVSWTAAALFVLVEDRPGRPEDSILSFDRSATAMASGCAIVLYRAITGRLLWYRGVVWEGFLDGIPDFGEDVTDLVEARLPRFVADGGLANQRFPKIVRADDKTVHGVPGLAEVERVEDVSIEEAVANPVAFASACVQMSVCLTPAEVKRASETLMRLVNEWEAARSPEGFSRALATALESPESARLAAELVHVKRALRRSVAPLVAAIMGMESARGASSRDADLKRANRRTAIQDNVRSASEMTVSEMTEMMEGIDEWLIAEVDRPAMEALFERALVSPDCAPSMLPHSTCLCLDGVTVSALVEQALSRSASPSSRSHYLEHESGLAIPSSLNNPERSAVPFPMVFAEVADPHMLSWADLANTNKEVAFWRIRLRGMLAGGPGKRTGIAPSAPRLGLLIVHFAFGILAKLAPSDPEAVESLAWDDTVPRLARGLMGLALSTMASGTCPLTPAYRMLGLCPPGPMELPTAEDAWVFAGIARLAPITKWPGEGIRTKSARLVATIVRKFHVDPVVQPLRDNMCAAKHSERERLMGETEEYLRFLGTTWFVLERLFSDGKASADFDDELRPVGRRLLALAPSNVGGGLRRRLAKFARALSRGLVDWEGAVFQHTLEDLVNAYAKRSGAFADAKGALLKAYARGDRGRAERALERIEATLAVLRSKGERTASVKPQNHKALGDCDKFMALRGDSELKRAPWSVKGDPEAEKRIRRDAEFVYTGVGPDLTSSKTSKSASSAISLFEKVSGDSRGKPPATNIEILEDLTGWRPSSKTTKPDVPSELVSLACDVCAEFRFGARLPSATEAIIEEWRDPVKGEARAVKRLLD